MKNCAINLLLCSHRVRQEIFPLRQNINPQFLAPARSNLVAGLGAGLGRMQSLLGRSRIQLQGDNNLEPSVVGKGRSQILPGWRVLPSAVERVCRRC